MFGPIKNLSLEQRNKISYLRIYRGDGSFGTVTCTLETTVKELIQTLARKFFILSVKEAQLVLKTSAVKQILDPNDRPLAYQLIYLELMGYTSRDNLENVGREDITYLCQFTLVEENESEKNEDRLQRIISSQSIPDVNLHNCNLRTIPTILFKNASLIENLNLSRNPSIIIPLSFIKGCTNLKRLEFSQNRIRRFPGCLAEMTYLKTLDLSANYIRSLPEMLFSRMSNLETLQLKGNKLANLPSTFKNLAESLIFLDLSSNYFDHFPPNVCQMGKLKHLDISFNRILTIPDNVSTLTNLQQFYLNNNALINRLPVGFASLVSLKVLDIKYNYLTDIDIISKLPSLEKLVCSRNNVSRFSDQLSSQLTTLYLNQNPISEINFTSCASSLSFLDASGAKLGSLSSSLINMIPNVETLILDNNHLNLIPTEVWNLKKLKFLSCANNNLESLPDDIGKLISLEYLDLHSNNICELPSEINELYHLRHLNLASNLLDEFPKYQLKESLANSLQVLILCDNRFNDDCFENISLLTELKVLNISYNYLIEIPSNSLSRLKKLTELYVSGNSLSSLPADDLESIPHLQTLFANFNKLHSLPAELGKNFELRMFDVGSNNLKYNINNWPYDWNWHFNLGLKYLNFSGNKRLEIKSVRNSGQFINTFYDHKDLSDFMILSQIRVLGLMDVTLTTSSVPDQSENCRVRTYGSEIKDIPFGMADTLGDDENLSIIDLVIEQFRGNEREIILGIFDGQNQGPIGGNKISKLVQENFGAVFIHELKKMRNDDTVADALRRAFLCTNRDIGLAVFTPSGEKNLNAAAHRSSTAAHASYDDGLSGSCGTVCYIQDRKVYVANIGDTMAIVATSAGEYHVLTHRHDICGTSEFAHIRAGGGFIDSNGRLAGVTTVSRAFGFYNLIPYLMAGPTITEYDLTDLDELIIIGSRELWDYMSYESVVDIALTEVEDPMNAANKLRDFAISYGSKEKIMVMCISVGGASRRKKQKMMMKMASGSISTPVGHAPVTSLLNNDEMYPLIRRRPHDRNLLPEDSMLARLGGEVNAPIGQLAMVFTDIQKSTQLWETHPIAMRSAIKIHNAVMRRQLRIVGGYEVKTEGDAFMVSFSTAPSALLWCLNVQAQLLVAEWPAEILQCPEAGELASGSGVMIYKGLLVRMGIHWGSPVCERDPITKRMDYYGPMVNRAARIGAKADGGQIMVSADFLSEMKRIQSIYKTQECNGGFISVKDEDTMKKIETNGGYVLNEVGETKLKGLENAEFLSLIFSKHLIDRADYPPINTISPSQEVFFDTIGVQSLLRIRDVSLRLEKICSRLNGKQTTSDHLSTGILPISNNASLPPTQQRLISLMDHVVTRIENSLVMLYLRISLAKSDKLEAKTNDDISIPNEEIDETSNFDLTLLDRDNQYSIDRLIHTIQSLVPQISQVNKA
ncbi:L domain-like protein [Nadsonia fulvescens var. elongata DSM 6958]|uniref:Adenylate cyclase n=1 Tax=Nadsonia fulvescens var. elongata DSM 6958 TaxID=857566 RepID=A0A1E3PH28_9ASCO|nr:L domain-like protein [Nadsonia fulvescens var. elongata DSM 6958]